MTDIVVSHLYKAFDGKQVLSDFSAIFPEKTVTAVMGYSGVGKTTLLRILMGLEAMDNGTVTGIQGARLAVVFQEDRLLEFMTPVGNIRLTAPSLSEEAIRKELTAMGLGSCMTQPVRELSGGMRQRLAMARALTCDADLLLMDEPLSALDALLREEMQDMLKRCWREQGYAQVLVTHSIEEAVYLGQRIVVMSPRPGRVVHVLENAEMQQENWRDADLFFERCRTLREMLRGIVAKGEVAHA